VTDMSARTRNLNELAFDAMDTEAHWYWLGFLLADGSVFHRRCEWRLAVSLRESDRDHLEALREFLGYEAPLELVSRAAQVRLVVYSMRLCRRLFELGVVPRKSFDGHPMPVVPNRFAFAFVRGHFDGNGHACKVSPNGYKLGFAGQHRLMRWMQERLRHLVGVPPGLFYDKGGCAELVYGRRHQVRALARWLYGFDHDKPGVPHLARKRAVLEPLLEGAA